MIMGFEVLQTFEEITNSPDMLVLYRSSAVHSSIMS